MMGGGRLPGERLVKRTIMTAAMRGCERHGVAPERSVRISACRVYSRLPAGSTPSCRNRTHAHYAACSSELSRSQLIIVTSHIPSTAYGAVSFRIKTTTKEGCTGGEGSASHPPQPPHVRCSVVPTGDSLRTCIPLKEGVNLVVQKSHDETVKPDNNVAVGKAAFMNGRILSAVSFE